MLLSKGASVHSRDLMGKTPLHRAASPVIAEMLLDHGARINSADAKGQTPLREAMEDDPRRSDVAEFLKSKGARSQ
jgi:ankyrin repeat protein